MDTLTIANFTMDYREHTALSCAVPCSLYSVLARHGVIDDPYFGENEKKYERLAEYGCTFRAVFDAPASLTNKKRVRLVFYGIDTLSDVYLNGKKLGSTDNMHRTWKFDVRGVLRTGRNELTVQFRSPIVYIEERHAKKPLWCTELGLLGYGYIRKAACSFGWDWGPVMPDMGFYRNVTVEGTDDAEITSFYVSQRHETGAVHLTVSPQADGIGGNTDAYEYETTVTAPNGTQTVQKSDLSQLAQITVHDPALWWPNGYGAQPLYTVCVRLKKDGKTVDEKVQRIGLRTLTVSTERDEWGSEFCFAVNGEKIFSQGANYIPEDAILSRVTKERTRKLLQDCADAHFNTVRVWGGGYYPDDCFYELCDEMGLIVWQDFMFANTALVVDEAFAHTVKKECEEQIVRLRNHACLGLFCGNNEIEDGWREGNFQDERMRKDYLFVFEQMIPSLVSSLSPDTFYWRSSPSSVGGFIDTQSQNVGDMHYWDVWHGCRPMEAYETIFPRFLSEYGYEAYPAKETLFSVVSASERNPFSAQVDSHQKCWGGNAKILAKMADYFPYARDFGDFVYVSQVLQAEAIRICVEHLRRNRGRCMGSLYWQLNDVWPGVSWSSVDYYGRKKALHYLAKRFYAPVLLSAQRTENAFVLHLCNETREQFCGTVQWRIVKNDGSVVRFGKTDVSVPRLSSQAVQSVEFAVGKGERYAFVYRLIDTDGNVLCDEARLAVKPKRFAFLPVQFTTHVTPAEGGATVRLSADAFAMGVSLSVSDPDAVFSENWFALTDGDAKTVHVRTKLTVREIQKSLTIGSYNRIVCEM